VPRPLGQHFLTDPAILDRIVAALQPNSHDDVIEIGPGEGTLTRRLAERVGRVVAIEKDHRLVQRLREAEPPLPDNVMVVEGDALEIDWGEVGGVAEAAEGAEAAGVDPLTANRQPPTAHGKRPTANRLRLKIVGNIPYYITSPLIEKALQPPVPLVVVYLVQKEVADRVVAAPGSKTYGALSIGVQAVARAERLFVVRAGAFRPPPAVHSAVIRLTPLAEPLVSETERGGFRTFVVGVFGQRRKQITGGLRSVAGLTRDEAVAACEAVGIRPADRPETLTPGQMVALFRSLPR